MFKNLSKCPYCGESILETCMGYPVEDLIKLSECLKAKHITPEKLGLFIFNLDWAVEIVMQALKEKLIKDLKCHKVTIKTADNNNIEGERK